MRVVKALSHQSHFVSKSWRLWIHPVQGVLGSSGRRMYSYLLGLLPLPDLWLAQSEQGQGHRQTQTFSTISLNFCLPIPMAPQLSNSWTFLKHFLSSRSNLIWSYLLSWKEGLCLAFAGGIPHSLGIHEDDKKPGDSVTLEMREHVRTVTKDYPESSSLSGVVASVSTVA